MSSSRPLEAGESEFDAAGGSRDEPRAAALDSLAAWNERGPGPRGGGPSEPTADAKERE